MNNSDQMRSIMEAFYNAAPYGMPGAQDGQDDKETVTYNRTKKQGDATVTVSANADSMDELHQILKLAGIDAHGLEGSKGPEAHDHEEHNHEEPEMDDCCYDEECEDDCGDEEPKMKVISLNPQGGQGYNSIGGDKKEILNALMNRYKSL